MVVAARHLDPAPRAQILLPEHQHRHQRTHTRYVEPVNLLQQGLVIDQAHEKHHAHAGKDPVDLLDVRPRKLRVLGGALNLHHAQSTNDEHEDQ